MNSAMIGVDVGGTFTDVVSMDDGHVMVAKVPTDVESSETSVLAGASQVGVESAEVFNLASTAGLNAVITRRLPKIGLLTTGGHRDVLDAGTLARPSADLTQPRWRRSFSDGSAPLVPRYLRRGVRERVTPDGSVFIALDEDEAREQIRVLGRCNVEGVAIGLLNSYVNPVHEHRLAELVEEELGSVAVSVSSVVSPVAREYGRFVTTVIDVVMQLLYGNYTERLESGLDDLGFTGQFNYADCRAMLMPADYAMERPHLLVVGGPAAGTVASAHFGRSIDDTNLLCADVGGTSCDLSLVVDGRPWVNSTFELEHDLHVNALSTDVITLGAGGGSIVSIASTGEVRVGPDSAGADPGPACYGKGGTRPTTTDAALLMGILQPDGFAGGQMALDPELSFSAFGALDTKMHTEAVVRHAWGVGVHNIAEGIFNIALRHGLDTRDFTLLAYGAAGPMLLPSVLDVTPLRRVVVPPNPGGFSALGLLSSDQVFTDQRSSYEMLEPSSAAAIGAIFAEMETGLLDRLGLTESDVSVARSFDGRLAGQGNNTPFVPVPEGPVDESIVAAMNERFHDAYELRNGNRVEMLPVQAVTYRVEVVVAADKVQYTELGSRDGGGSPPSRPLPLSYLGADPVSALEFNRDDLCCGDAIAGPAVVREPLSTTYLPTGRDLVVGRHGELVIS
ncbi:MAG: hydantoinase/oxoprolinase family protein [Acidimicrobiales bacterium]